MIGGPNDLVIESQIIRAESREPRDFRDARIREKKCATKSREMRFLGLLQPNRHRRIRPAQNAVSARRRIGTRDRSDGRRP